MRVSYLLLGLLMLLASCSSPSSNGGPPTVHDAPEFQAAVGTYNTDEGVMTNFEIRAQRVGDGADVEFVVTGPEGWNGNQVWTDIRRSGPTWLLVAETPAMSGMFHFSTVMEGVTYTDSMELDASQVLDRASAVSISGLSPNGVTVEWDPVDRADSYWVILMEEGAPGGIDFQVVPQDSTRVVFTNLSLVPEVTYRVHVHAYSESPPTTPEDFTIQIDSSLSLSEPFQLPGAESN